MIHFASYPPQAQIYTSTFYTTSLPQRGEGVHSRDSSFSGEKYYSSVPDDSRYHTGAIILNIMLALFMTLIRTVT